MAVSDEPAGSMHPRFPEDGSVRERLEFLVRFALMAPSEMNTQPWSFAISEREVELWADGERALKVVDPQMRGLFMSCGAAVLHLRLALRRHGYRDEAELFPDGSAPHLVARMGLSAGAGPSSPELRLFDAIPRRQTNRSPFSGRPIPVRSMNALEASARQEGAWLHVVRGEEKRAQLADMIARVDEQLWSNPLYREEMSRWIRNNDPDAVDGVPGYAEGMGDLAAYLRPFLARHVDSGLERSWRDREMAMEAPELVVLWTSGDQRKDWVRAGQALARTLLRGQVEGVSASYLNQPLMAADLRVQVAELLGFDGHPQLVFALGYGKYKRATPRRPLKDVVEGVRGPAKPG